jgi:predicted HAD superfamily Cof-like phosphohydrolase
MQEELDEYSSARSDSNLAGQLDALVDILYVAIGTAYQHGFDLAEAWRRVHEANMQKVRVQKFQDSTRGSLFDVVKPPGWVPPNLEDLV